MPRKAATPDTEETTDAPLSAEGAAAEETPQETEAPEVAPETPTAVGSLGAERKEEKAPASKVSIVRQFDAASGYLLNTHKSYADAAYMTGQTEEDIRRSVKTQSPVNGFQWAAE